MGKMRAAALMFVVLLLLASSSEASLMDGLVGYWSFDNCDVNDYSGNANDGILHGEPQFVDGISGSAISLNGNGDFIDIPIALESSTSGFTFSAWVNTDTLAVNESRKVIHTGILGEGQLDVSNGSFSFAVKLTDNYWYQVQAPATQNQWVFLVGQYSRGETIRLYVNGELGKSMMVPDYSLHTAWDL